MSVNLANCLDVTICNLGSSNAEKPMLHSGGMEHRLLRAFHAYFCMIIKYGAVSLLGVHAIFVGLMTTQIALPVPKDLDVKRVPVPGTVESHA